MLLPLEETEIEKAQLSETRKYETRRSTKDTLEIVISFYQYFLTYLQYQILKLLIRSKCSRACL